MTSNAEPRRPAPAGAPRSDSCPRTRRELWEEIAAVCHFHGLAAVLTPPQTHGPGLADPRHPRPTREEHKLIAFSPIWPSGWIVLHLGISASLLWLSTILLLPTGTIVGHENAFGLLAPEWAWSLLLGLGACVGFWGAAASSGLVRCLSCGSLGLLHTLVAICLVCSGPAAAGSGAHGILGLLAFLRLVAGR